MTATRRIVLKRKIGYVTEQEPDVQMEREGEEEEVEEERVNKKTK